MKELQLLLKRFLARGITLDELKDRFGELLEKDKELPASAAAWLDAAEKDGLLSAAVCTALKSVLISHMAATSHGPDPASSGIFSVLDLDGDDSGAPAPEIDVREGAASQGSGAPADATYVRDEEATRMSSEAAATPAEGGDIVLEIGSIVGGRYELISHLGSGGMGRVYKARDRLREEAQDRNPHVALKVLSEEFKLHPDSMIALQREVRRAQQLAHPNVITVHEFFRDGPHLYMTMELLEGRALDQLCQSDYADGISYAEAWPIIEGISKALQYGHDKGIVHSDIKPGNIFLCEDGTVKVLDLGISRPMAPVNIQNAEETAFDPGKRLGSLTPAYAALEMWYQDTPDPRDDIYALACVVYVLLTGRHPFDGRSAREAKEKNLVPRRIESLTRGQWQALVKGLAFERADRTESVNAFRRAFEPQAVVRRNRLYALAAAAAVIIAVGLIGIRIYTVAVEDQVMGDAAMLDRSNGGGAAVERPELSDEQVSEIESLLSLAELQFGLVKPDASADELEYVLSQGPNNVVDLADTVLAMDPGYEGALAAKRRAFDTYLEHARRFENADRHAEALALIQTAADVMPNSPEVLRLRRRICGSAPEACAAQ
jgi:hypothetical protein